MRLSAARHADCDDGAKLTAPPAGIARALSESPPRVEARASAPQSPQSTTSTRFQSRLMNCGMVAGATHKLETWLIGCGADSPVVAQICVALDELLTNIFRHGYAQRDLAAAPPHCELRAAMNGPDVEVVLIDDGAHFDPLSLQTPDLGAPAEQRAHGGLGVHFVRKMMDEVRYRREGSRNVVTLRKRALGA